jgi:peptidoglycan/LPS O-acetylase OafA/YrhL
LGAVLLINRWHGLSRVASVAGLMVAIGAIPFLFRLTKDLAIDRNLGELSYPIYICHYLVIWFLDSVVVFNSSLTRGCAIVASTVIVSAGLLWFVDRPIDNWRHRRFAAKVSAARPASEQ